MAKKIIVFTITIVLLCFLIIYSMGKGSIELSYIELFNGLFVSFDERVAIVYDLRFPRIFIAVLAGAGLSVSGAMFQSVMKNPLADPGIIGVASASTLSGIICLMLFPHLYMLSPLFAFLGGMGAFVLVYALSWKSGLKPLRVILVGVAVNAVFVGIMQAISSMMGANTSLVNQLLNARIDQKTWMDVKIISIYVIPALIIALIMAKRCNLLSLEDKTVRGLGINVDFLRIIISVVAVLIAAISTSIVGVVGFLGLIVPHIGRLLVGTDNRYLLPFCIFGGALMMLLADTIGRTIMPPIEIPISVFMAVVGGPFFIFLLRRSEKIYGN